MNFTLKQLVYIEAAGRLGSIAQAANEISISQSSITAAIDGLEASLDFDLFVRTPAKGIRPTSAGAEVLSQIRSFIQQARNFESDLTSIGKDAVGTVRIACYATAAPAFLPIILKNITDQFPGTSVQVLEGNMIRIIEFLNDGKADIAFTYRQSTDENHQFLPLFSAQVYALVGKDDPLATSQSVSYAELAERPLILLDLPLAREYYLGHFQRRGLRPRIAHSTRSAEIARALVAGGFGYTLLNIRPPDYVEDQASYRAIPIRDAAEGDEFGIATLARIRQPKTVRAFVASCLQLKGLGAFGSLTVWSGEPNTTVDDL